MLSLIFGITVIVLSKILKLNELTDIGPKNNVVLCYGHFSTIHPGHLRYLIHAKNLSEKLMIAVIGDSSNSHKKNYMYSQDERAEALSCLNIADYIVKMDGNELHEVVKKVKPQFLVLGKEYEASKDLDNVLEELNDYGGIIQYHAGANTFRSNDFFAKRKEDISADRINQLLRTCERQKIHFSKIKANMREWNKANIVVIGDAILDQYTACEALGMSAEAPVLVVRELEDKCFLGGAAIVAAHIKALEANTTFISVLGEDETGNKITELLRDRNIKHKIVYDSSRPTTFKKRYLVENQKLFRVSRIDQTNISSSIEDRLIKEIEKVCIDADAVIVSDFVYGVITPRILESIRCLAKQYNFLLLGDVQCSSQMGSILRFHDFTLLCPNERELRLALQDKDNGVEFLSRKLLKEKHCKKLLVKMGSDGFIAYDQNNQQEVTSQSFPALSVNPIDVTGAGDSVLAIMAVGMASRQNMMETAVLACCMGALAVETLGNKPISISMINNYLDENFSYIQD